MEPIKETLKELTTKLEPEELSLHRETGFTISNKTLKKMLSLQLDPELDSGLYAERNQSAAKSVRDYLRVLFRHKGVILATFLAVVGSLYLGLQWQTPQYQAQVKMLIHAEKQVEAPYYREIGGFRTVPIAVTQSEIVNSYPVIQRATKALGLYDRSPNQEEQYASPLKKYWLRLRENDSAEPAPIAQKLVHQRRAEEALSQSIQVKPIRDTNMFTISARDYTPIDALLKANLVSRSYVIFDLEQQLAELHLKYGDKHMAVMELKDTIDRLSRELNGLPVSNLDAIGPASVKIIEQAQLPLVPSGVDRSLVLIVGCIVALILAVSLAFGFDFLDPTFKSAQEIETFLNMPYLGSLPRKGFRDKLLVKDNRHTSPYTQSYQKLSDQILWIMKNKSLSTLLVTSASNNEGATVLVANLGICLSHKSKQRVLLVDGNFRSPSLHKLFNLPEHIGFADLLEGKVHFDQAVNDLSSNLSFLSAGKTIHNPLTLLDNPSMTEFLKMAQNRYDFILFDCGDLNRYKDAYLLSVYMDGIMVVVEENRTRKQVLKKAVEPWENMNGNVIGAVLNNRTSPIPRVIYEMV